METNFMCKKTLGFMLTFCLGLISFELVRQSNNSNRTDKSANFTAVDISEIKARQENLSQNNSFPNKDRKFIGFDNLNRQMITAGRGTEDIYLGMSKTELLQILGLPRNELSWQSSCFSFIKEMQWFKADSKGNVEGSGVYVYLKNDLVYAIKFSSPRFLTSDNLTDQSLFKDLLKSMPNINVYRLTRSSSNATNGKDKRYAVNENKGVAYELDYNKRGNRIIGGIYVFEPFTKFPARGCVGTDQELILENNLL
jgi:hypothetical protein